MFRKFAGQSVLVALCAVTITAHAQRTSTDSLRLVFFDVGQGDAAMISTPDGRHILIDAGPSEAGIAARIADYGVRTLDLVVASHNHADHIGGMPDVFATMHVLQYMDNGVPALTRVYRRTVDAVTSHKALRLREATSREFRAGKLVLRILAPPRFDESQNGNSVGIWVQYGSFSAVFAGDAERGELLTWLGSYHLGPARVVKASHHGSLNGTIPLWMTALSPRLVVVSVGAANQYGHPATEVLAGWASVGARVCRTDSMGTITISAAQDGGFRVRTATGAVEWVSK